MANIKASARQVTPVTTGEGDLDYLKMTKLGALFTADWKQQLILAGLAWEAHVGGLTTSADIAPVVGGGNGTVIDAAQPELVINCPAGYYMIVMEAECACYGDPVTDNAVTNIALFADRTQQCDATNASATAVTPLNLLDGASPVFPGSCLKACTGDLTASPVGSELLAYSCNQLGCTTGGSSIAQLKLDYKPTAPSILAGPCAVALLYGGTAAQSGMGVVKVAVIPASYAPVT